jgi:hypothetical protein
MSMAWMGGSKRVQDMNTIVFDRALAIDTFNR